MAKKNALTEIINYISFLGSPATFIYNCKILTEKMTLNVKSVNGLDGNADYVNGFADEKVLELVVTQGEYDRYIYPNRENIQIQLEKIYVDKLTGEPERHMEPQRVQYIAIPQGLGDTDLHDKPAIDKDQQLVIVKFDLQSIVVNSMRYMTFNGPFRKLSAGELLTLAYVDRMQSLNLPQQIAPQGLTASDFNVKNKREQIIVPHGTRLMDLPIYLQKYEGGIYNHSIGMYYDDIYRNWFIYPLHDCRRFEESKVKLEVYLVRSNQLMGFDDTHRIDKDDVTTISILSTSGFTQIDTKDVDFLNSGNGVKFSQADKVFDGHMTQEANKGKVSGDHLASFYLQKRGSDFQVSKYPTKRVTTNTANEMSKLAAKAGQLLAVSWEFSRPDLLMPGMPVRVYYDSESAEKYVQGTLLNVKYAESPIEAGSVPTKKMTSSSRLLLFVENPNYELVV
tara:strand:- start:94005 stop:95357 length:1353 start_codon:yes stop_codon:yes gene_type:complete